MRAAAVLFLAAAAVAPGPGGPGGGPGGDPGDFFGPPTPVPTPAPTPAPPVPGQDTAPPAPRSDAPLAASDCPTPASIAAVTWTGGAVHPDPVNTDAPQAWLPSPEQNLLRWPEGAGWLNCAVRYRLGQTRRVAKGTSVNVNCASEVCDVYAIFYHAPTHSTGTNGNLPLSLSDGNWTPSSCSPAFTTSATGPDCWYPTVAYRKQVLRNQGAVVEIDANVDSMYLTVVVVRGTVCNDNIRSQSQQACEASPANGATSVCGWDAGAQTCSDQWCPRVSLGGSSSGGASSGPGGGVSSGGGSGGCPPPDVSVPQPLPR